MRSRLTGSNDWEEFAARGACRPILGGGGNVEDLVLVEGGDWSGYEGCVIRLFEPATMVWSIYWFDNVVHRLPPSVHGVSESGVGVFFGADVPDGQPLAMRRPA